MPASQRHRQICAAASSSAPFASHQDSFSVSVVQELKLEDPVGPVQGDAADNAAGNVDKCAENGGGQ